MTVNFVLEPELVARFQRDGYAVTRSPLTADDLEMLKRRHDEISPTWETTAWPDDVHRLASQFCLMGEAAFALAERPEFLEIARGVLGVDDVFVGACAAGDTVAAESVDGRPVASLQWHCAPGRGGQFGEAWPQVALRFPMDVHDETNGGLHLVPGSQDGPKAETEAVLRTEVGQSEDFLEWNGLFFGTHPRQVVLYPKPGDMIVWTPNVWHCTGANPQRRRRRSITWTYFGPGGRFRDHVTLRHVVGANTLDAWTPERRRLWGLA